MKPIMAGLLFCLTTAHATRAQETIDISKITCKDFVVSTLFEPDHIAYWLSGYYNGNRGNTVLDVDRLQDYVAKVRDYCQHNRETTVMKAAEALLAAGK
jgi:acid stress chaperone HdeB